MQSRADLYWHGPGDGVCRWICRSICRRICKRIKALIVKRFRSVRLYTIQYNITLHFV